MWIEYKGDGLAGPVRIGWVHVSQKGKRLDYRGKSFHTLSGQGFKSNYYDTSTGEEYWITGCRKDGRNALYSTNVEIDEDAAEHYWVSIRGKADNKHIRRFHANGKYKS